LKTTEEAAQVLAGAISRAYCWQRGSGCCFLEGQFRKSGANAAYALAKVASEPDGLAAGAHP